MPDNGSNGLCWAHSPELKERRRRGQSRGGKSKASKDLADLKRLVMALAEDVLTGTVDRADAAVAGQLYNTAIRATSEGVRARESEEYEQRLRAIEERVSAPKAPWLRRGGA